MTTLRKWLPVGWRTFNLGTVTLLLEVSVLNATFDLVRSPFINQVAPSDEADEIRRRRGLLFNHFIVWSFLSWSDDKSTFDGGSDGGAVITDSFADAATSLCTVCFANYAIGANTTASVAIDLKIFDTTFGMMAIWTIRPDLYPRIDNMRL